MQTEIKTTPASLKNAKTANRKLRRSPQNKKEKRAHKSKQARPIKVKAKRTKTTKILSLLSRPSGASIDELCKATGWQAHSVRGFLSGTVKRKLGLNVNAETNDKGTRRYWIENADVKAEE